MEQKEKTWAFFYQMINLWNTSFRYPGWVLATKEEMKNIIKNAYMDGFKVKIEKSYEVEETIANSIYKLKNMIQEVEETKTINWIRKQRKN